MNVGKWTAAQEQCLRDLYPTATTAREIHDRIAKLGPERSLRGIFQRAKTLGLISAAAIGRAHRNKERTESRKVWGVARQAHPWAVAEDIFICEAFPRGDSIAEIISSMAAFGSKRSDAAIRNRARILGLCRPDRDAIRTPGLSSPRVAFHNVRFADDPRAVAERLVGAQPVSRREVYRMSDDQESAT